MGIGIALVLGGGSAACDKASPSERARRKAAQVDFWPEAPKPAVTAGTRTLAYQPANLHGYRIDIDVASLPGADMDIRSKMRLDLTMRPGPTPQSMTATTPSAFALGSSAVPSSRMKLTSQ